MSYITYNEIQDYIKEDSFTYSERQFRSRKYKKNERRYQRRQKQQQRDRNFELWYSCTSDSWGSGTRFPTTPSRPVILKEWGG